jgi:hypothetical protein
MNAEYPDTRTTRELPVLASLLRRFDAGELIVELEDVRAELEMTGPQMMTAATALRDASPPYIELEMTGGWTESHAGGHVSRVYERTRRELGSWPSPEGVLDQLVAALREEAEREREPDRKGRLRAAADALGSIARDLAVRVISDRLGRL